MGCQKRGQERRVRAVTYYSGPGVPVFLLSVFGKHAKANLTPAERNELRTVLAMLAQEYRKECGDVSKAGESILRGAREALAFARGAREGYVVHVPEQVDVKAIRRRLGLSQRRFAERFGFKLDAVQNWEQGRRRPEGAARAFLRVIEREPDAVRRALSIAPRRPRPARSAAE